MTKNKPEIPTLHVALDRYSLHQKTHFKTVKKDLLFKTGNPYTFVLLRSGTFKTGTMNYQNNNKEGKGYG
jgi:hypothetical protein